MTWLELAAGLLLLLGGGEALVRGGFGAAHRLGVSPLVIGLTLLGFGASTPELAASLEAALAGAPDVAVGAVVGSNIANILLILGVSAAILPVAVARSAFRRDGAVLVGATLLIAAVALTGALPRWAGLAFVALLVACTLTTWLLERRAHAPAHAAEAAEIAPAGLSLPAALGLAAAGGLAIVLGAGLLVDAAVVIARAAGLSEAVIGLTLVAVGASLPELATSVMAAIRRQPEVAFGNIVGSNIFNILSIAEVTAVVTPLPIASRILALDLWVMIAATLLLVLLAVTGWRVTRREAAALLVAYAAYLALQLSPALRGPLGLA